MAVKAKTAVDYIEENRELLTELADAIWEYAELALHEERSSRCLANALEEEGFDVDWGVADMPTAFIATWGSGDPVVGFLGEYDALAGLSQKPIPRQEELEPGGTGHGCGHNLLGTGALGAAIGLKEELKARNLSGTIKYFGCPAEENLSGKTFMAREGVFDVCDVCFDWHPSQINRPSTGTTLANNAANFTFHGRSAHAAGDPFNGRSALDAVQLLNMGVEFLREHMPPNTRIHYVITDGGSQPNVVPAEAKVWYLVRGDSRDAVDDLWERVLKCVSGAAEMTETTYEVDILKAIYNVLPNEPLIEVLFDAFERVGPPDFGPEELEFAEKISETIPESQKKGALKHSQVPEKLWDRPLCDQVLPRPERDDEPGGSTDVGDVSWCCPTARLRVACNVFGTPGHSWQFTAQSGMSIGHEGMLTASKVLAEAALEVVCDEELLERVRAAFEQSTGGKEYESALPPDLEPAFDQFAPE
jgi:aminobenzoyl-glutamate utilization protein B